MLTGLRINADVVTPSRGLYLTCMGKKYIQSYTIIYSTVFNMRGFQVQKSLTWGDGLQSRMRSSPLQSCAPFLQAIGPKPSPSPPLQAQIPTHVIQFKLAEDDIGT